jgi:hypothetical protein
MWDPEAHETTVAHLIGPLVRPVSDIFLGISMDDLKSHDADANSCKDIGQLCTWLLRGFSGTASSSLLLVKWSTNELTSLSAWNESAIKKPIAARV